jgi:hypothetical protein
MSKRFGIALTALTLLSPVVTFAAQRNTQARRTSLPRVVEQSVRGIDWEGTYEFSEGGGHSTGAALIVTHTLVIRKHDDALDCDLDAEGFQTSVSLRCDARGENGKLNIYFNSYREGNTFARYRKGQLLMTLERTTVRGKPRLLTRWGAYHPIFDSARGSKVCFKKIK